MPLLTFFSMFFFNFFDVFFYNSHFVTFSQNLFGNYPFQTPLHKIFVLGDGKLTTKVLEGFCAA